MKVTLAYSVVAKFLPLVTLEDKIALTAGATSAKSTPTTAMPESTRAVELMLLVKEATIVCLKLPP